MRLFKKKKATVVNAEVPTNFINTQKNKKMTKTKNVLLHLQNKGNITSWEAINLYSATRLSAIIFTLRHKQNYEIVNETIPFTDKNGYKSSYAKYIYKGRNEINL